MKVHFVGTPCNTNLTRRTTHSSRTTKEVTRVTCAACRKLQALDNPRWVALMVERGIATNADAPVEVVA